jgi:RHS repeat-associated protein
VTLPARASAPAHLEDVAMHVAVDVALANAQDVAAQSVDGYNVYPHAHASGATMLARALPTGAEDFISFETRPSLPEIDYRITLGEGVSGLRLVADTLEMLGKDGAPRLRAAPPYIVGADGTRTDATLAVEGCAVDEDASAPWGRPVMSPGARTCTVRVRWPDDAVAYPAILDPRWTTTGSMTSPRQGHTATLLSTGKVLVVGGTSNGTTPLASAELYDRTTGTWAATASMTGARTLHTATQLNTSSNGTTSGKVLIAGGRNGSASQATAQLYSPTVGTWTAAANLNAARDSHTATLLADGRVLVAGGVNGTATLPTAAIYNPASGTGAWTATTGSIPPPGLKSHTATLLVTSNNQLSNKVLLVGGNNGTSTVASVFLFDPTQSSFSTLSSLSSPREGQTATVLANGNILITGGKNGSTVLATTMLFNPSSGMGSWTSAGTMTTARQLQTATALPSSIAENGQVLVAGGSNGTSSLATAELWNGSTWTLTSALSSAIQGQTATLLSNNMVLIAGGVSGTTTVATAALYDASFGLGCTSSTQCTTGFCVNGVCCDTACNGGCGACNLSGKVGTCSPVVNGTVCRASTGTCDVAETCNGAVLTCPADGKAANGTACNDNNACTSGETCQSGTCGGGTTVTCTGADTCHTVGACVPATGCPAPVAKANGTTCNDNNACTSGETCQSGTCRGGTTVTCTGADTCHTVGACVPATGCPAPVAKANGTACNDNNACTNGETCQSGTCGAGTTVTCAGADNCHTEGACVPATGCPAPVTLANGTACNDNNACTNGETCQSGTCGHGTTVTCTGADTCHTVGACVPATGCPGPVAKANGTACNDNNACTTGETCQAGTCGSGTAVTCTAADTCHTAVACVAPTGCPAPVTKANGTTCDDGNVCTQSETCQGGACQASNAFPTVVNILVDNLATLGGTSSSASGINASGQLVGQAATPSGHLDAMFCPSGQTGSQMVELFDFFIPSIASAINDAGFITGSCTVLGGSSHLFRYGSESGFVDLGQIGDGLPVTDEFQVQGAYGYGIDASGQLTGIYTDGGQIHGFRYTDGIGFEDVGSLGGIATYAYGIDPNTGTVVGGSRVADSPTDGYERQGHAFKYDEMFGMVDLNSYVDPTSGLLLINASGVSGNYIVGGASRAGIVRAFRLNLSKSQVEEIPSGWEGPTFALATNSHGDTVGWGYIDAAQTKQAAFIYSDRLGFKNLNDVIASDGWSLQSATSINDSDEVVGEGSLEGIPTAFHLNLKPESVACNQQPGVCGQAGSVCVWADGIVDVGDGQFLAVFGYNSSSPAAVTPTQNEERLSGTLVTNPQPAPPNLLQPGIHTAAFVPAFSAGQTVSWTVNGQTATASADLAVLSTVPLPNGGMGVDIGGTIFPVRTGTTAQPPSLTPIAEGIVTQNETTYGVFSYTNPGSTNINVPYGTQNQLSTSTGGIPNPSPPPPTWFLPGTQRGVLIYPLTSPRDLQDFGPLSWTLGGQTVTLSTSSTPLQQTTQTSGTGVSINGTFVVLFPNPNAAFSNSVTATQQTNWGLPMPASFAVAGDGAATARVPIWVPPGRAGLQPSLALTYNSHNSTEFEGLGPGWAVEGLSEITRCPKTLARDGVVADVTFSFGNGFDSWCLDGQRLIIQSGGTAQGGPFDNAIWRTEQDRFAKIVSHQADVTDVRGPDSFDVFLKDGRILHYGGGNATVEGPITEDAVGATVVGLGLLPTTANTGVNGRYTWALASTSDRSGNTINYSYTTTVNNDLVVNVSNGNEPCVEQHINTITYGSQAVQFDYTPAVGPAQRLQRRMFVNGLCLENTLQMTGIDISGPRPETGQSFAQLLKHYVLTVQPEGLTSVVETDTDGVPKTVGFHYENASPIPAIPSFNARPVATASVLPLAAGQFPSQDFSTGDINGDGFDDLVYLDNAGTTIYAQLSNGGNSSLPPFADPIPVAQVGNFPTALQIVDADMDGKADIFYSHVVSKNLGGNGMGGTLTGFFADTSYFHSLGYDATTNTFATEDLFDTEAFSHQAVPIIGDLNGDSLPDMTILDQSDNPQNWTTHQLIEQPFSGATAGYTASMDGGFSAAVSIAISVAGKFVSRQAVSFLSATNAQQTFLTPVSGLSGQLVAQTGVDQVPYSAKFIGLDLNGDGLTDLVSIDPRFGQLYVTDPTRTTPIAFINTGNGFRYRDMVFLPTVPPEALVSATTNLTAADINKDGLDDLLILSKNPTSLTQTPAAGPVPGWFYPSNGNGLAAPSPIPDIVNSGDQPFMVLDYNGDGRPDILTLAPQIDINTGAVTYSMKVYENKQPRPLLTGMFGGLNDTPGTIVYDAVGRVARNTPGNSGCPVSYPTYCPATGPLVVTQAYYSNRDHDQGEDGILETYSYNLPRMDALGRGWLGVEGRRVIRSPISDPNQVLTVEDTQFDNGGAAEVIPGSGFRYYYPLASKPTSDITYYAQHGGALENTATAVSVGTDYTNVDINFESIFAWVPKTTTTKKRTVSNFDQILSTIQPAFDANQWPTVGATDITSSRSTTDTFDGVGNPTGQESVTNLSDGSQVSGTVTAQYQSDQNIWLVSQPTRRTVTETTSQGTATRSWLFTPDSQTGLLSQSTYQAGIPDEQLDTTYVRNTSGQPISIKATIATGESRTTSIGYDDFDGTFPKQVTNALGQTTRMAYHPGYGFLIGVVDPNGQQSSWTYDEFGRVTSKRVPDGTTTQIHYENPELQPGDARLGVSQVFQIHATGSSGAEAKVVFDTLNRQTVQLVKDYTGTAFDAIDTAYDPHTVWRASRVTVEALNPLDPSTPVSTFGYDNMGRPTTITMPDGNGLSYTYGTDASVSVVGPDGQSGSHVDDGRGLVLSSTNLVQNPTEASGHTVTQTFKYGPFGEMASVTVGNGPTTTIKYDASGRRIEFDDPDRGHTTSRWNGFGDPIEETDADGSVTVYTPDALGRVQQVMTADGITTYEWDTAANGIGAMSKTTSPDNVVCQYTYDSAGRPAGQAWTLNTGIAGVDGTYSVGLSYDQSGRLATVTYPSVAGQPPVAVDRTYFPNGRLAGLLRDGTQEPLWTANSHNERGQIASETAGNGVSTTYDFPSATGLLHEVTSSSSAGQVLRDIVYEYDEGHRTKQRTTDGQVEIFQHDTLDRLVDWQTGAVQGSPHVAYTYDDLGNLTLVQRSGATSSTSTSFTPGDGITQSVHQIVSSSLGTYSYDARGDQYAAPGRTVAYTTFGLPKSVTNGTVTSSFAYDGGRSRVLKVNGSSAIVSIGHIFERRIAGGQVTDVFYEVGEGNRVGQILWTESGNTVSEQVQYFHGDAVGSIETVTDTNGQVVGRQQFEPFGARISAAIPGIRLGYQGAEHDDELGLINMNGRIYDPSQYRFITVDPLVGNPLFSQDLNRYAFVRNSPLNLTDPSGLDAEQANDGEDPPPNPCGGSTYCAPGEDPGTRQPTGPYDLPAGPPVPDPDPSPSPADSSGPGDSSGSADDNGSHSAPPGGWYRPDVPPGEISPTSPLDRNGNLGQAIGQPGQGGTEYPLPGGGTAPANRVYAQFFNPPAWLYGGSEKQQREMMTDAVKFAAIGTAGGAALMVGGWGLLALRAALGGPPLTLAIGRLGAPAAAWATFGYEYLQICKDCWNPTVNAMILRGAIEDGYRFYLASPATFENFFDDVTGDMTVFGYEFAQLLSDGFKLRGNFLVK